MAQSRTPICSAPCLLIVAALAGVFVADVSLHAGLAIPMFHALPVMLTGLIAWRYATLTVTLVAMALTLARQAFAEPMDAEEWVIRGLSLVLLVAVAALVEYARRARDRWLSAEAGLRKSMQRLNALERRYEAIHAHAPFAIALARLSDRVLVSVNPAFERLFGFTAAEVVGRSAAALGIATAAQQDEIASALQSRQSVRDRVVERRNRSGDLLHLSLSVDRLDLDGEPHLVFACEDVTARYRAEQALAESERGYRALFEMIDEGFLVTEPVRDAQARLVDLRAVRANPACARLLDPAGPPIAGRLLGAQMDLLDAEGLAICERVLATSKPMRQERHVQRLDRWFDSAVFPYSDGELAFLFSDITYRKRAEQALARAYKDLEERGMAALAAANRALRREMRGRHEAEVQIERSQAELQERATELEQRTAQLSRLASELTVAEQRAREALARTLHDDLQQLLVGTLMQVDSVAQSPAARARGDGELREALERLRTDLEDAVTASRSLAVELFPPILHEGNLPDALEWLASWVGKKYGLRVAALIDPDATLPQADMRTLVFESVRELLFNVVKHAHAKDATLKVTIQPNDTLDIVVADTGVGFDAGSALDPHGRGRVGLGLFSIRERLGLMGGRFEVDSRPGDGSSFTLVVPRRGALGTTTAPEVLDDADARHATPHTSGSALRIVMADDHAAVRTALRELFASRPGLVIVGEAQDGAEALEQARRLRPDVVVMDARMPRMSGIDATRQLHRERPDITVVGISTDDQAPLRQAMLEAGAEQLFVKGTDTQRLLEFLGAKLAARSGGGPAATG